MEIEKIAEFKSPFGSKFGIPRQSGIIQCISGEIHFEKQFRNKDALRGLEEFDYLWLLWGFSAVPAHPAGEWQPTVRPPRLGGNKTMGVFATRSPFRPNPLGLSCVRLDSIDFDAQNGPVIHVLGADLMDGTPIYDIKPYVKYADSHPEAHSGFAEEAAGPRLEVTVPEDMEQMLGKADAQALAGVLSLDPRPGYHNDPNRIYGILFKGIDIHFKVSGKSVIFVR